MKQCDKRHAWLVPLAFAAAGLLAFAPTRANAQPNNQSCSAALDVDVHYCKNPTPPPPFEPAACDPSAFTDGMPVDISVEITNQSTFVAPFPPGDPPAGEILAGTQMKIFYSCNAATCAAGTELPGRFGFNGIKFIIAGAVFVDDGNGYSGTLTFGAPVPYTRGDTTALEVLRLDMTARVDPPSAPPAGLPGEQIFARAGQPGAPAFDDSSNLFLITDLPECLPGLLGGGQGTTAGLFAQGNDGGFDVCRHANKQVIKIDRAGTLDYGYARLSFELPGYDPSTCDLTFGYDNAVGGAFQFETLVAGSIVQTGKCYTYANNGAKNQAGGGVQRAQLCPLKSQPDRWCLNFKGFGEFDQILVDPEMPITLSTCGNSFSGPSNPPQQDPIWNPGTSKWILPVAVWATP